MNFKIIHIGKLIQQLVIERRIEISRICNFMKCTENEISDMYIKESLDTEILLKWSKLLEYDFFRIYSQHLILYAPAICNNKSVSYNKEISSLPNFRKNIYTKEIIDYLLNKIKKGEMTTSDIIEKYNIPKTTIYKWKKKYS